MTELLMGRDRSRSLLDSFLGREQTGRHAFDEDAALTPIFHALTRGGWRDRQHEPTAMQRGADPVDEFHRDPLTAPLPTQAVAALPEQPWRRASGRRRAGVEDSGRHRRFEPTR